MKNLIKVKKILTPFKVIEDGYIVFDKGRITEVGDGVSWKKNHKKLKENVSVMEFKNGTAVPGLIDIHIHGSKGFDFMYASEEALKTILEFTATGGVSSLLATTRSASADSIEKAIGFAEKYRSNSDGSSKILGVHIESNYYNKENPYRGAHPVEHLRNPKEKEYSRFLEYRDFIKMVSVAPELPGAKEYIKKLKKSDITVAAGHTGASYKQILDSMKWGVSHVIHLYSGMSTVVRIGPFRVAGTLEASLCEDGLTIELIGDLIHLPAELLKFAVKCKGYEKVCVITDAIEAAGLKDGIYDMGEITTMVKNGVAMTPDKKSFVGSTIRLIDAVRNMVNSAGVPVKEAVRMATYNPAKVIGVENRKGSIEKGKDADILILDDKLNVIKLFVA